MKRFYYYVVKQGDAWVVRWDHDPREFNFSSKDQALAAAISAARANWEQSKLHSGVKIQTGQDEWEEERTFGDDPYPPIG